MITIPAVLQNDNEHTGRACVRTLIKELKMKLKLTGILAIGLLAIHAEAQNTKPPQPPTKLQIPNSQSRPMTMLRQGMPPQPPPGPMPDKATLSYAIGVSVGTSIKAGSMDVDVDAVLKALGDTLNGKPTSVTPEQARDTINNFMRGQQARMQQKRQEQGEKNKTAGPAFLAENKKKDGIKIIPVPFNGKTEELQYKVLKEGTGAIPKSSDRVSVHYTGTLLDGTVFDSSRTRNTPASFGVTGVIKGWTEALQQMKVGSQWQLFIPSALAYGEGGGGAKIAPNAVLIFDVELLAIETPPVATAFGDRTNQVVSGEIIKVPSAAGIKKGEKIEVIKSSDSTGSKPK